MITNTHHLHPLHHYLKLSHPTKLTSSALAQTKFLRTDHSVRRHHALPPIYWYPAWPLAQQHRHLKVKWWRGWWWCAGKAITWSAPGRAYRLRTVFRARMVL